MFPDHLLCSLNCCWVSLLSLRKLQDHVKPSEVRLHASAIHHGGLLFIFVCIHSRRLYLVPGIVFFFATGFHFLFNIRRVVRLLMKLVVDGWASIILLSMNETALTSSVR